MAFAHPVEQAVRPGVALARGDAEDREPGRFDERAGEVPVPAVGEGEDEPRSSRRREFGAEAGEARVRVRHQAAQGRGVRAADPEHVHEVERRVAERLPGVAADVARGDVRPEDEPQPPLRLAPAAAQDGPGRPGEDPCDALRGGKRENAAERAEGAQGGPFEAPAHGVAFGGGGHRVRSPSARPRP